MKYAEILAAISKLIGPPQFVDAQAKSWTWDMPTEKKLAWSVRDVNADGKTN